MDMNQGQAIPILTYHSIDDSNSVISVSVSKFQSQLSFLRQRGFKTYSLQEMAKYIKCGEILPRDGIVITFDDGYQNNYTKAFSILQKYSYTATVFLTSGHCGKINNWRNQHSSIPQFAMLSWDEVREMCEYGIEFGAHSQKHINLAEVNINLARKEIIESKKDIEKRIHKPVELFSYPYGRFNKEIRNICKNNFKAAISNNPGKIDTKSDLYALERINVTGKIFKLLPFKFLHFGSFNFYLIIKKAFNQIGKIKNN